MPIVFLIALLFLGCEESRAPVRLRSHELSTAPERVAIALRYLRSPPSTPLDAVFDIAIHDNGGGMVPGPSDSDVRLAVRVDPADVPRWIEGWTASDEPPDTSWFTHLAPATGEWRCSAATLYRREGYSTMFVCPAEGVVGKRAQQH